jgi:putative transposase
MKYAWIYVYSGKYPVALMCRVLGVSRSGYYNWHGRGMSPRALRREGIALEIHRIHSESGEIYGHRKVHGELLEETEFICCLETVRTIMKEEELCAKRSSKYVVTTDSSHNQPVANNLLARDFEASGPNEKWVSDITYIRTLEGWLYLATTMDLWARNIVGWAMSDTIDADLVCDALKMAVNQRHPSPGLIHHSDRGVQYASDKFQGLLNLCGIKCSMSRKGNCWDNAPAESFFGKLKTEHVGSRIYRTRREAEKDLFWYIEVFYNRKRRHASLGYISPAEFERRGGWKMAA